MTESTATRRWAVLGGGRVSESHVRALVASPHARVVAVMDRHPERVGPLAEIGGADPVDSLDELLERDDVEAATVALPTAQHPEVIDRLAAKGIHVLCEKPLAPNAAAAAASIARCRESGVELGVIFNTRGLTSARWVHEQIAAGGLDVRAVHVDCRMGTTGRPAMTTEQAMGAIGVHYVDLMSWWLGEPSVLSMVDGQGSFTASMRFDGAVGDLRFSSGGPTHHGVSIEVVTPDARITLDTRGGITAEGDVPTLPPPAEPLEGYPFGPGHRVVIAEAAAALAAGDPFPVDGEAGRHANLLCDTLLAGGATLPQTATLED